MADSKSINNMFSSVSNGVVAALQPTLRTNTDRKTILFIDYVYDPDTIGNKDPSQYIVPRVGDMVIDPENGWYLVTYVDIEGTLKSTLTPWNPKDVVADDETDITILGGPYHYATGEYLVAIDYSQNPPVAMIDNRIYSTGSMVKFAKLFKGNDISENGEVVSAVYNNSGDLVGNAIPLEAIAIPNFTSNTLRRPVDFAAAQYLENGERCTLVFYDENGHFSPPAWRLCVQQSAFIRHNELGKKYVKEIELISPFLTSKTDPNLLQIPINVNLAAVEFRGRVWYNDGSPVDMNVTGSKMVLNGLDEYIPSVPGQMDNFVLEYFLSAEEEIYLASPGEVKHKARQYRVKTIEKQGAYSPKLYAYPVWVSGTEGYKLVFFLLDLDRKVVYNVTDYIRLNSVSPAFDPLKYGTVQHLTYNVSLKDVDARYEEYTHRQSIDISLLRPGTEPGSLWTVGFDPNQNPAYGLDIDAKFNTSSSMVNIRNGFDRYNDQAKWLDALYFNIKPLVDSTVETVAPTPTHFILYVDDNNQWRFPIDQWWADLNVSARLANYSTLYIKWVKVVGDNSELQLGVSGLTVRQVS